MTLEERYNNASANSYVGRVRSRQANDAGAGAGVDFMDGQPKKGVNSEDKYQTEFIRNDAGSLKNGKPGQNGQTPGSSGDLTGLKGLSRWTADALNIAFTKAGAGLESIWNARKGFKSSQTVKWSDPTDARTVYNSYHRWTPSTGFINSLSATDGINSTQSRVKTTPKGPSPAGFP